MKGLLLVLAATAVSYQTGCVLGHRLGVSNGTRIADAEWACFLENGMVGPGSTTRPGSSASLSLLTINGAV